MKRLLVILLLVAAMVAACGDDEGSETEDSDTASTEEEDEGADAGSGCPTEPEETSTGVIIEEIECGDGAEAVTGVSILVHYTGSLEDGTEFDSSAGRNPLPVDLGAGMVVPGFEEGLIGMKVGGKRKITIPPELAYGEAGVPGQNPGDPPLIPPNSTLIFELELVEVVDNAATP